MKPVLETNLEELSRALRLYQRATGLSVEQTLAKKGTDVGHELRKEWRGLMPEKGSIRASRIAALKAGEGVRVRPWIREDFFVGHLGKKSPGEHGGPRLNWWQMAVRRELNVREQGRGFLGQAARFLPDQGENLTRAEAQARSGIELAEAHLNRFESGPEVTLEFGFEGAGRSGPGGNQSLSVHAVMGILKTRGLAAASKAVADVTADIVPYLERKLGERATAVGLGRF